MFEIPKEESSHSSREKQIKVFPFYFDNIHQRDIGIEAEGLQAMPQANKAEVRQTEEAPVGCTKKQAAAVFISYFVHSKPVICCPSDDRQSIFIDWGAHIYSRQYIILSSSRLAGELFRSGVRLVALTIIFLDMYLLIPVSAFPLGLIYIHVCSCRDCCRRSCWRLESRAALEYLSQSFLDT